MTREEAHKLVDQLFDSKPVEGKEVPDEPKRELPKDKRVVRTKASGDRVYLIDENKKTRAWLTNPEVLKASGFEIGDVQEVDDSELLKYQMAPAIYRVES